MDTKINIKEEESLSDDVASQNGTEFFPEVVTMKRERNTVLLDDDCDMAIKTEIKAETPFPKHPIKTETVTSSSNWDINRETEIEEQTLVSNFGSPREGEFLSEAPVMKNKKYKCDHEMDKNLEIKEEPWWLERETQPRCYDLKDEDFPPVKYSRLCTEGVSSVVTGKSPLIGAEVSGRDTTFYPGKHNPEFEHQNADVTEMPTAEEHVLSEQSGQRSEGEEVYLRPLHLNQKSLIPESKSPHLCKTCDKRFTQLSSLKTHNLTHEGKKPYQCETCDKSFTQMSSLKTHYLIHEGKKPFQCKTCVKSFTRSSDLNQHNLIHEGKKPHQCKACDKRFTRLSHLKTHYLIHEGKKPHQCNLCDKSFTQLSHLKTHYLTHGGKKPHHCKTCDKSFTRLSHLKAHYFIHKDKKPHQCITCHKSFTRLSNLKTHYLIHEGKKPHQCKTCDKSFTLLSTLKTHNLIHEGKKPHQCKACDKSFTRLSHLKTHHLIHESKKSNSDLRVGTSLGKFHHCSNTLKTCEALRSEETTVQKYWKARMLMATLPDARH